jgi:hypothetical protein
MWSSLAMAGKATFVDETIKGERKDEAVVIKRAIRFTLASLFLSLVNGFRNYLLSVSLGQARRRQTKIPVIVSKVQMEVEMPHPSVLLPLGTQPPCGMNISIATSSAACSTPVCPPDMIFAIMS